MTDTTEKEKNSTPPNEDTVDDTVDDTADESSDKKGEAKKESSKKKKRGTLSLSGASGGAKGKDTIRQSGSRGRSKVVEVEVRRRRTDRPGQKNTGLPSDVPGNLTMEERKARLKALKQSIKQEKETGEEGAAEGEKPKLSMSKDELPDEKAESVEEVEAKQEEAGKETAEEQVEVEEEPEKELTAREKELAELKKIQEKKDAVKEKKEERAEEYRKEQKRLRIAEKAAKQASKKLSQQEEQERRKRRKRREKQRQEKKLSVNDALRYSDDDEAPEDMAALRRKRAQKKAQSAGAGQDDFSLEDQVSKEVTIPETISVQELSNRMAEKGADVIKQMMQMGVMVTINQTIDADTAELVVEEMGHTANRVSESDVEEVLQGPEDDEGDLEPRAPVVTVMGHVDHGKTSLLDALRQTDVVGGESGGITQHIGAYQVTTTDGDKVTFIDTPGHAAFTEMRARGADITDIVILVIAADDSVMPQTIEAINHAKAADVPIIVAINKVDLPAADPDKIKQDLLRQEVIVEDMGGQVITNEVSAINKQGLDELLENIILQAEVLELKANPQRKAHGAVVEAKLEQGRGNVATVLIQTGSLSVGDIFVAGAEWGRVRALIDDHGDRIKQAGPSQPVEVLGLNGSPMAGDDFAVVEDEGKAREISEYRTRKHRERQAAIRARGSVEQMLSQIEDVGEADLPIIIKADVHGSVEAIQGALRQLDEDHPEVNITALHTGVGGINESDISLAAASNALVIGFNVRANSQARDLAKRDGVDMHYYSIIYNVIDDIKGMLSGMLSPEESETTIGYADVRQVFSVSKVGNVAGCRVTEGEIRRNAKARLIRDDVVVHETTIDSLKRGKDDAKEVREGFECGIHLEGFDDIKEGDVIECFEIEEIERTL